MVRVSSAMQQLLNNSGSSSDSDQESSLSTHFNFNICPALQETCTRLSISPTCCFEQCIFSPDDARGWVVNHLSPKGCQQLGSVMVACRDSQRMCRTALRITHIEVL